MRCIPIGLVKPKLTQMNRQFRFFSCLIGVRTIWDNSLLKTTFLRESNFSFLHFRYIKAALLPMQLPVNHMCCTKAVVDLRKPTFGETFPIAVPLNKLYTKTLQVNVWCTSNESEECLVCTRDFLFSCCHCLVLINVRSVTKVHAKLHTRFNY